MASCIPWAGNWCAVDWPTTLQVGAAIVQALGALLALYVAISIDRRAATRLRADRQAEWDRQRQEREAALREAQDARIEAIENARVALVVTATWYKEQTDPSQPLRPPVELVQSLETNRDVLKYYLSSPEPLPAALVQAVAFAHHALKRQDGVGRLEIYGGKSARQVATIMTADAATIASALMDYRSRYGRPD